ncbi:hypothetical protein ACWEQ0_02095 [Nocardia thailandica]
MSAELAVVLRRLEIQKCTGVLRTGDGAIHFTEGAITSADCRRTTGLERLAVESGVATAEEWRRARSGDPSRVLHRPRLEALAVLSVFDAAYFLMSSRSSPEFRPGPAHWMTGMCRVAPRAVVDEFERRRDATGSPWPADLVDRVPVVPTRRVRQRRIALTGGQVEVLAAADSRRSVAGIARDLGRTTYGCLVAVRELTDAGLVERPGPAPVPITSAEPRVPTEPRVLVSGADRPTLARRRVRATPALPVPERWEPVDRDVLIRLKAALEGSA